MNALYINVFEKNETMLVPINSSYSGYYDRNGREVTKAAFSALKAAQMAGQIGRYAAIRYALNNGSSFALFRLAQQLMAMDKINLTRLE